MGRISDFLGKAVKLLTPPVAREAEFLVKKEAETYLSPEIAVAAEKAADAVIDGAEKKLEA